MAEGTVYRIHPGIGIARVGDSPDSFYLSPERPGSADGVGATGPRNPVKGHGVCNPNVEYGSPQHVPKEVPRNHVLLYF